MWIYFLFQYIWPLVYSESFRIIYGCVYSLVFDISLPWYESCFFPLALRRDRKAISLSVSRLKFVTAGILHSLFSLLHFLSDLFPPLNPWNSYSVRYRPLGFKLLVFSLISYLFVFYFQIPFHNLFSPFLLSFKSFQLFLILRVLSCPLFFCFMNVPCLSYRRCFYLIFIFCLLLVCFSWVVCFLS